MDPYSSPYEISTDIVEYSSFHVPFLRAFPTNSQQGVKHCILAWVEAHVRMRLVTHYTLPCSQLENSLQ